MFQCSNNALQYIRKDNGKQEVPKNKTNVEVTLNRIIYLKGNLAIKQGNDTIQC